MLISGLVFIISKRKAFSMILRLLLFLTVCLTSASSAKVNIPPPKDVYNIFMLLPFGSPSHRNVFLPLAVALADRGHNITMLSALPPKFNNPNITEVNHGVNFRKNANMFSIRNYDPSKGFFDLGTILAMIAREMYGNPKVMELYEKRHEYDLFIVDEIFSESAYPFLVGKYFITISTAGIMAPSSAVLGNLLNPSFVPGFIYDYPSPYSLMDRIMNLIQHIAHPWYFRIYDAYPRVEETLREWFPDMPSLVTIEKGLVLILANTHYTLDAPIPLLPSQIEVGGMHCQPGQPLTDDLKQFIEDPNSPGTVYFSLGTIAGGLTLPDQYKNILLEAFGKLKYRVIWKFEEKMPNLPNNIIQRKWLPQQDILAHPKVKLFITHGGLLSMQEAIYHRKPMLSLPIFGDQERNSQRIKNRKFGLFLLWESLTVDDLLSAIEEVVTNPEYLEKVRDASEKYQDQPQTPLERAVWWTEYVIRHEGAPQLRSHGANLSWIEYLMLDIVLAIGITIPLLIWIFYKAIGRLIKMKQIQNKEKVKRS